MIDELYPVQPGGIASPASPRRLPGRWLWTSRALWVAIFLVMLLLNGAAVVAHFERNASGLGSGALGLRATQNEHAQWVLDVDPSGPASRAGLTSGNVVLRVNGNEVAADASFKEVNRLFYGQIGESVALTLVEAGGEVRERTVALVPESSLSLWRRIRVPLEMTGLYLPTIEAILLAIYLLTSALIFWRRSDDWMALYLSLTLVLITPQVSYNWYYLSLTAPEWENVLPLLVSVAVALTLPNFYLIPNGLFVPRWTAILTVAWVIFCIGTELFPEMPFSIYRSSGATQLLVWLGWFATGMLAQVYRYRYEATPTEQQQIKWVAFGLTVAVVVNLGWILAFELFPVLASVGAAHRWMWVIGRTTYVLGMMMLPLSFGIAVFRYRLWDIDNLINRTLVYGTLTVVIVSVYAVVVTIFDLLFSAEGQIVSEIIAITLNLIIFEPLRDWLQTAVDRLMFGESEALPEVIARLGQRLGAASEPSEVLSAIVETLAQSLDLPYVAITLRVSKDEGEGFRIAAASGAHVAAHLAWPLVYRREAVGQLLLGPRTVGVPLKPNELEIVAHIAYQVSAAVHDLLLDMELQRRNGDFSNNH
jgi:hypothetical protein